MRWSSASRTVGALLFVGFVAVPVVLRSQAAQVAPNIAALPQAWTLPPPQQRPAEQTIAVRAGRLFDPRSGTLRPNQIIVIRGERIVSVGPAVPIPAGAEVIDLTR